MFFFSCQQEHSCRAPRLHRLGTCNKHVIAKLLDVDCVWSPFKGHAGSAGSIQLHQCHSGHSSSRILNYLAFGTSSLVDDDGFQVLFDLLTSFEAACMDQVTVRKRGGNQRDCGQLPSWDCSRIPREFIWQSWKQLCLTCSSDSMVSVVSVFRSFDKGHLTLSVVIFNMLQKICFSEIKSPATWLLRTKSTDNTGSGCCVFSNVVG